MLIPYLLVARIPLLASGQGSFIYPVPQGQKLNIDEMVFVSTGIFSLIGISNANGLQFTNATGAIGIPSTLLSNGANNFNSIKDFKPDLIINGGDVLTITVLDTSVAVNTVTILINSSKELPG